jgi:RNA polymerase sigma-70 factor (ECF subfamily)
MLSRKEGARALELYSEYGGLVYRRCLRLLRDEEAARSGVQEVFVRVMSRLEKEEKVHSAARYLFRVATNYCLHVLRERKRLVEAFSWEQTAGNAREDPAEVVERRLALEQALSSLSQRERLVAHLHFGEGMTQAEVAEIAGLSRKTVCVLVGRLRRRFGAPATAESDS